MALIPMVVEQDGPGRKGLRHLFATLERSDCISGDGCGRPNCQPRYRPDALSGVGGSRQGYLLLSEYAGGACQLRHGYL